LFGFFLTAWHPHSAALASIYAGSDEWQYLEFVRLFSPPFIFWNLFWGILMYSLGSAIEGSQDLFPVFLLLVIAWLLWEIARGIIKERRG
jgi:membrane protein DedA with SNARE-associated domain